MWVSVRILSTLCSAGNASVLSKLLDDQRHQSGNMPRISPCYCQSTDATWNKDYKNKFKNHSITWCKTTDSQLQNSKSLFWPQRFFTSAAVSWALIKKESDSFLNQQKHKDHNINIHFLHFPTPGPWHYTPFRITTQSTSHNLFCCSGKSNFYQLLWE